MPPKPTGKIVYPGSYTECVDAPYPDQPKFDGFAPAEFIVNTCSYVLGGKLRCLPPTNPDHIRCAIGRVVEIEEVGYCHVGFDGVDNDWCINLLLAPNELSDFKPKVDPVTGARASTSQAENAALGEANVPQGHLIKVDKSTSPPPHENKSWSDQVGAFVHYFFDSKDQPHLFHFNTAVEVPLDVGPNLFLNVYNPLEKARDDARDQLTKTFGVGVTDIPVLHCEVEGSRAHDFCAIAVPIAAPAVAASNAGSSICHSTLGKILPFGWGHKICKYLSKAASAVLQWPAALAAIAAALPSWGFAKPGDADVDGLVGLGDGVIISGRWVLDAAHTGANELHPVLTLQKVADADWTKVADLSQFTEEWCHRVTEAPLSGGIGTVSTGLTPEQQVVHDRQQDPDKQWVLHPALDGCQGSIDLTFSPPPPPPPPPGPVIK
jgi:hypothetical protein